MKTRPLLLGSGLLLSLGIAVFGDKTPNASISAPVLPAQHNESTVDRSGHGNSAATLNTANRTSNIEGMQTAASEQDAILQIKDRQQLIAHGKQAASLFDPHSWAPPPKPAPQIVLPPPPPKAPPLPFTYMGKQKEGEQWMVFLKRGNATFIVKPLDVIEAAYRVETIAPPSMTLTYLPLNQPQTLLIQ